MTKAILTLLACAVLLAGCGQGQPTPTPGEPVLNITVAILPQKYFVEQVGGDHVQVDVLVQPGSEAETYEPKPEQLRALSRAVAYVRMGLPFEDTWMPRIRAANPNMRVVDLTTGIERIALPGQPGTAGAEAEGSPDPHIWLSPPLVKIQAQTIHDALVELDAENAADYGANLAAFEAAIDALDADIRNTLQGLSGRTFMTFHPAWGYFAETYDLQMISVEVGGQEPSAAELTALIAEARELGIRVIFAEPQFSTRAAETIAEEIDGEVILVDDLAEDWADNLREVANEFASALRG